jgi:hypothetical protein
MFSRKSCYFFVRPKRNFLEVCVFLGRTLKAPQVRRVDRASRYKIVHVIQIRHRDDNQVNECNGDVTSTTRAPSRNAVLAIMPVVWQKFHILSRSQVFALASACAVVIALAVALASIPADGTSWNRFLGPSRQFDPFINFGSAFVSVLPIFLGYYHLARLGALVGVAVSAAMFYATQVCAFFVFGFQLVGHSMVIQGVTYVGVWLLLIMLVFWVHMKASSSHAIRDAQRC